MREEAYGTRLLVDESGKEYVQKNPDSTLVSVDEITSVEDFFAKCRELFKEFAERAMKQKPVRANVEKLKRNGYTANLDFNHMYRMQDKQNLILCFGWTLLLTVCSGLNRRLSGVVPSTCFM